MLSLNELRRLVKKHNQLMSIIIPPKTNRDALIKLIEKNGFTIDHDKKKIIPKIQMKRKPTVPLPPAPPKKTEAEKKVAKAKKVERDSKRDKVGYDNELKKRVEAVKKARASKPPMKKENEVRPKQNVGRPRVNPNKIKVISKPVPKGSHRMPDGSIMKDKDMPKKKPTPPVKSKPFVFIKSGETSYDIPASNKKTKSITELKQAYNKLGIEVFTWTTEADKYRKYEVLKKSGRKEVVGKIPYIDPLSQIGSDPRGGSYGGAKPKPKPVKPGSKGVKVWTGSGTLPNGTTTKNNVLFESRWRPLGYKIANLKPSKKKPEAPPKVEELTDKQIISLMKGIDNGKITKDKVIKYEENKMDIKEVISNNDIPGLEQNVDIYDRKIARFMLRQMKRPSSAKVIQEASDENDGSVFIDYYNKLFKEWKKQS